MIVIGLCGGSGSGKGSVARIFAAHGIPSVDCDAVYHKIVGSPGGCLDELVGEFGTGILSYGILDRRALAETVFSDKTGTRVKRLNAITHKYVIAEAERMMDGYRKDGVRAVVFDAPLLFESGYDKKCDVTVAVIADRSRRVARIMERDGLTADAARRRIDAQLSDDFLIKNSDYVIHNNGTTADLTKAADELIDKILF